MDQIYTLILQFLDDTSHEYGLPQESDEKAELMGVGFGINLHYM